jgi:predicted methyltransferase
MSKRFVVGVSLAVLAGVASAASAQDNAADAATLISELKLAPGSVAAEIGAGGGELTVAIARHVGPGGRVISTELGADRVQRLRQAAEKGADNITVIEGHENRTNLPDACCDAVFLRNVYHHFGDPPAMNGSILRALKPGGRVAVIDFPPRNNRATAPPGKRGEDASHGVSAAAFAAELEAAGFQIVKSEERPSRWFIVVGAKPAS